MIDFVPPEDTEALRKQQEMEELYRTVFGDPAGRRVLGNILAENHFGVPLNTEIERHEYNVAIAIARKSGIMSDIDTMLGIEEG